MGGNGDWNCKIGRHYREMTSAQVCTLRVFWAGRRIRWKCVTCFTRCKSILDDPRLPRVSHIFSLLGCILLQL